MIKLNLSINIFNRMNLWDVFRKIESEWFKQESHRIFRYKISKSELKNFLQDHQNIGDLESSFAECHEEMVSSFKVELMDYLERFGEDIKEFIAAKKAAAASKKMENKHARTNNRMKTIELKIREEERVRANEREEFYLSQIRMLSEKLGMPVVVPPKSEAVPEKQDIDAGESDNPMQNKVVRKIVVIDKDGRRKNLEKILAIKVSEKETKMKEIELLDEEISGLENQLRAINSS